MWPRKDCPEKVCMHGLLDIMVGTFRQLLFPGKFKIDAKPPIIDPDTSPLNVYPQTFWRSVVSTMLHAREGKALSSKPAVHMRAPSAVRSLACSSDMHACGCML